MEENQTSGKRPRWTPEEKAEIAELVVGIRSRMSALRNLRQQLNLSQNDVAELLGVTQSNVSKLESSKDIKISILKNLVERKGGHLRIVAEIEGKNYDLAL